MIEIKVLPPIKNEDKYEFRCEFNSKNLTIKEFKLRCKSLIKGFGSLFTSVIRFGFVSENFKIKHHEIWDSIFPLMFLTRNGGLLFNREISKATIYFEYPILEKVKQFYIKRANDFGLNIKVEGITYDKSFDISTSGNALSFGGGKDSRLLLGMLREIKYDPEIYVAGKQYANDQGKAMVATTFNNVLAERVIPALMAFPQNHYFGSGLGEVVLKHPWQQYYDFASYNALKEFSKLMKVFGINMVLQSPVSVLPYNIIQKILYSRYNNLYKYQCSVSKNQNSEKNLHVCLCKIYHDIDFQDHCSIELFKRLLNDFVNSQIKYPKNFGYRDHREIINKEMRSIIYKMKKNNLINEVKNKIPEEWNNNWIDYIHTYVYPEVNKKFLRIYKKYAKEKQKGIVRC